LAKSRWSFKTAVELSAALAAKKVSAVELAQDAIGRIERHDAKINAVCVRDFERGLAAARAADAALARGEHKPLLGIPMTVKESYNVAGLPTTWGNPAQKDFMPAEDALPISRVKDAGGVILGKTNVPIGLGDWQSYNDIYGTTNNPFDLGRTPGGSSGGSSAAVAAGYGALSLGSLLLSVSRGGGTTLQLEFGSEPTARASFDIYGGTAGQRLSATLEISRDLDGPALATVPLALTRADESRVVATGTVPLGALPPGDYVVRGIIRLDDGTTGRAVRTLRKVVN